MTKAIMLWTRAIVEATTSDEREAIEKDFAEQAAERDDWIYCVEVKGKKYFVADNGKVGYTAMLTRDY